MVEIFSISLSPEYLKFQFEKRENNLNTSLVLLVSKELAGTLVSIFLDITSRNTTVSISPSNWEVAEEFESVKIQRLKEQGATKRFEDHWNPDVRSKEIQKAKGVEDL